MNQSYRILICSYLIAFERLFHELSELNKFNELINGFFRFIAAWGLRLAEVRIRLIR